MRNIKFKNILIHLKTVFTHKYYVFIYCKKCGIPIRGLLHDMSKLSPIEFINNIKYVEPGKSPITVAKERDGYSKAWMHHKSHNPHHHVYWMDRFDEGCYVTRMPYKYMVECLCDHLGANKAYNPKSKTPYTDEINWWKKERQTTVMHPDNIKFLDEVLYSLYLCETEYGNNIIKYILNKKKLKEIYNKNKNYDIQIKISSIPRFSLYEE